MIDADVKAGVADSTSRYLLFQDNLDSQSKSRNPDYISYLASHCKTDDHKVSQSHRCTTPMLPAAAQRIAHPTKPHNVPRVLYVCVHNRQEQTCKTEANTKSKPT